MTGAVQVVQTAAYRAFYDLIACALETHNPERAARRVEEARDYLPQADVNRLVAELEVDYYEFT
jgi:hypothetical protein